jgi:hypothetical protein
MDDRASIQRVTDISHGHIAARCLHVVAELNVADAIGDGATNTDAIAAQTGANADALGRMLRLLAAHGLFASAPGGWVHTPASRLLRTDHPQSLRSYVRMNGMPAMWDGFTGLEHPATTGKPARDWAGLVAYFADHPEQSSLFNAAMLDKTRNSIPQVVAAYDFARFATIVDVGGGRGHLLEAILAVAPRATGFLFDLPHVIADAASAEAPRLKLVAGDFFSDPLPSADAYVLMEVLHDWASDDVAKILAAVRRAAPKTARVLIIETLVSESPEPSFDKTLDIIMLAVTGGRERTRSEYAQLLAAAGWQLTRVFGTTTRFSIVEAVPI